MNEHYKAQGFTHVYRDAKGKLWGIKLFGMCPVWCRIKEKAE